MAAAVTDEKWQAFIEQVRGGESLAGAARRAGISVNTVYKRRAASPEYKAEMDAALRDALENGERTGAPIPAEPSTEEQALTRKLLTAERAKNIAALETRGAKRELEALRAENERLTAELGLYGREFSGPEWAREVRDTREHHGTIVTTLSDLHAGERVEAREMDGFNAFNLDIADRRLERYFERTIIVARHYLAGVKYDGAVLALNGDLVSGDIHDELEQTNECSTYEAVEWVVPRLVRGIEMFAEEFKRVHVISAPGNHGRDSKKPRHKKRSAHNADTHIARLVAQRFDGVEGVTFDVPESFDVTFDVYGYTFAMEHGDNMRFSGTSEIGALGPVKRGTLRTSRQRQMEGRPFHYNLVGHFHQFVPAYTQGFIMNGSVKGYDEYARSWHLTPEAAQQALMVCTPEHGITVTAPILVQRSSDAEPGAPL